jgi:hypothetical protein
VRVAGEIALPHVILSDFDHAFKRAARIVFDGVPTEERRAGGGTRYIAAGSYSRPRAPL